MLKSRPLLLLVVTLCLSVVALASFWLAVLPERMLVSFGHGLNTKQDLLLEASNPQLSFSNGLVLQLENVSLAGKSENSLSLSAQQMRVETSIASLFGAGVSAQHVVLQKAVIAVDVSTPNSVSLAMGSSVRFEDTSLRLRDGSRNAVIALGDVNGTISAAADGSAKASLTFLRGDTLTSFTADFENAARLTTDGSPADMVLSAKDKLVTFSGRAKLGLGMEFVGQNTVEAKDAAAFFRWFGMADKAFVAVGPLVLKSGVSAKGLEASLQKLSGTIGTTTFSGAVKVGAAPDGITMSGELDVSRIAMFGSKAGTSPSWSEQTFSALEMLSAQLDLNVKVAAVQLRGRDFGPMAFRAKSDKGQTSVSLSGGTFDGLMVFEALPNDLGVTASLNAKGADARLLLDTLFDLQTIAGSVDVVANLKANGKNPAALVSTLSGDVKVEGKALQLGKLDLPALLSKPGVGWNADEKHAATPLQLSFDARVQEGVMTLQNTIMKSSAISLKPKGEIDILRQAFDFALFPQAKGTDAKLTLTGPWNKPRFSTATVVKDNAAVTPPAN